MDNTEMRELFRATANTSSRDGDTARQAFAAAIDTPILQEIKLRSVVREMFAVENWDVTPDLMTMGKGINSSYIPCGAVALSPEIYDQLRGEHLSGFTHSGHPLAAAAASKAIDLYMEENIAEHVARLGEHALQRLNTEFKYLPCVADVNVLGLMIGLEVVKDKETKEPLDPKIMAGILPKALEKGLITRARGTRLALCPPLTITTEEFDDILDILYPILADLK